MLDELTFGFPILSLLLFFPLVGAMILWLIEDEDLLKSSALGISVLELVVAGLVLYHFQPGTAAMDPGYLPRRSDADHGVLVDCSESRCVCHLVTAVLRLVGSAEAGVGPVAGRCLDPIHDVWQHRRDRAEKYQTSAGLFRDRPNRQCADRLGSGHEDGRGRDPVLPPHLSLCQFGRLCRRDRRQQSYP